MDFSTIILAAAKAAKVSGELLLAICMTESNLKNVFVPHDGGSPTYGICQVKYTTAQMIGYKGDAKGLMNPATNAKWAAEYLRFQKLRYESDWCKAVAAYNSGTYSESTISPGYPKNLKYVKKVQSYIDDHLQYKLTCVKNKKITKVAK